MPTTKNNTLPLNWDATISYNLGDEVSGGGMIYKSLVQGNLNHRPDQSPDYWEVLDIYKKDKTVLPHGHYGGDESFWQRDNIYIDTNGWVYVNNENTGINVKGRDGTVSFDNLTPEQIETLRGPQGERGPQGPAGPEGPQGPMGEVVLTPEQTAALKGDPGASAYQIWLDTGHTGTEEDFLDWLTEQSVQIDTELLSNSANPVENKAIYNAFFSYQIYMNTLMQDYQRRLIALENRLKALYGGQEYEFTFGITEGGNYGYVKNSQVIPFDYYDKDVLQGVDAITSEIVLTNQYATQEQNPVMLTIADFDESGTTSSTSLNGDPSVSNDEDMSPVYGSNVSVLSFEDAFSLKTNIFKVDTDTGRKVGAMNGSYTLYNMTENATNISSNDSVEDVKGFTCPDECQMFGNTIFIRVAPKVANTEVEYQIGIGDTTASLPTVIEGTGRYNYDEGSFNEEVVLSYPIYYLDLYNNRVNTRPYFASTSDAGYIIKEIYLE